MLNVASEGKGHSRARLETLLNKSRVALFNGNEGRTGCEVLAYFIVERANGFSLGRHRCLLMRGASAVKGVSLVAKRCPSGTDSGLAQVPMANSPCTMALAQTIKRLGLGIFDAFNEVGV